MMKLSKWWAKGVRLRASWRVAMRRTHGSHRLGRAVVVLGSAGMLAGCMVGPDFEAPNAPNVEGFLPGKEQRATISGQGIARQTLAKGAEILRGI